MSITSRESAGALKTIKVMFFCQSERILSFIPPDGNFRLMSYHIGSQSVVAIPIYVRHSLTLRSNGDQGRLDLTVGPKQTMGRTLESKDSLFCITIIHCSWQARS